MASSAGLRPLNPIIRFHDEYGSLGSCPTPIDMQRKVYRKLFTPVSEPAIDLTKVLYEEAPHRYWNSPILSHMEQYSDQMLAEGRNCCYDSIKIEKFPELTEESKVILAYFFPFVNESGYGKQALREFREKTIRKLHLSGKWSICSRNICDAIHRAMVAVWRRDTAMMGKHVRMYQDYMKAMKLELNGNPRLVRRIPASMIGYIAEGTGKQIYMAKMAHPAYE